MLGPIRKFSTSIYAKILLGIIVIPFVFWGMGSSFTGGSKNVIVVIGEEKYSVQEFVDFISRNTPKSKKISSNKIEEYLPIFIAEKVIENEVNYYKINLSNKSLGKLIKHQKKFKRENEFSRTEYEKFLLENNISAVSFEKNLSKSEKKKQFLNFIDGGVMPAKFLVDASYNEINQKRNIELINLEEHFKQELNFSEKEIQSYYDLNKNDYKEIYKSIKILELTPKKLIGSSEFDNLFFGKIDEIDDIIFQGNNLDFIIQTFNLQKPENYKLNKFGQDLNGKRINELPESIIQNIFDVNNFEKTLLIENTSKYFIMEIVDTESVLRGLEKRNIREIVINKLKTDTKRKLIAKIIGKIKTNNFNKFDFDNFAKNKNLTIKKISLENKNDDKILDRGIVAQIYPYAEKKLIVVHDLGLNENYLVYIDEIKNVTIDVESKEYKKYLNLSRIKVTSRIFNTYDKYLKAKYKIDINYKAIDVVKNYFN